jgi:hypothetical protein
MENPARAARGVPDDFVEKTKNPENNLDDLRAQYLVEIFALSPDTACTIAELVFGNGGGG